MKNDNLSDFLTDIANAIREKTGTTNPINAQNFSYEIRSISGDPSIQTAAFKDVNFYDYNGTILYSYYWDEFIEYNQLPPLPTIHQEKGLICYMWNYTLEEIIEQGGRCDVGAMYKTTDGLTHIFLTSEYRSGKTVTLNGFGKLDGWGEVLVDWGDGHSENYKEGITHTYDIIGKAEIIIYGGGLAWVGINESQALRYIVSQDVEEVWFGNWMYNDASHTPYFGAPMFRCCHAKYIVLPYGINKYQNFNGGILEAPNLRHINLLSYYGRFELNLVCPKLETLSFNYKNPDASISISEGVFYNSPSIKRFHFPSNVDYSKLTFSSDKSYYGPARALLSVSVSAASSILTSIGNALVTRSAPYKALLFGRDSYIDPNGTILTSIKQLDSGSCAYLTSKILDMSSITSIGNYAFVGSKYLILDYRKCTTIKSLSSVNCFHNCYDFKIVVPDDLYEDWKAATNWVDFASWIIKASDYPN